MSQDTIGASRRQRLRTGLRTSVVNNSSAFAFSITMTGTFGLLTREEGAPIVGEIFLFGMLAVAGFVALEAVASKGFRRRPETFPIEITMLGTAANFLSVAVAFGIALAATAVLDDTLAWLVGGFAAAAVFVLVESLELAIAAPYESSWVTGNRQDDPDP